LIEGLPQLREERDVSSSTSAEWVTASPGSTAHSRNRPQE
jgi:hypothetical protein